MNFGILFRASGYRLLEPPMGIRSGHLLFDTLSKMEQIKIEHWVKPEEKRAYSIVHVGESVSGPAKIIHGGMISTLLVQAMWAVNHASFPTRPFYTAQMTAQMTVTFKKPISVRNNLVILSTIKTYDGKRKLNTNASLFTHFQTPLQMEGASSEGLFISPLRSNDRITFVN